MLLGQGTRSHMPQLRPSMAKLKRKKERERKGAQAPLASLDLHLGAHDTHGGASPTPAGVRASPAGPPPTSPLCSFLSTPLDLFASLLAS